MILAKSLNFFKMSLFVFKVIMFLGFDVLGGIEVTNTLFKWCLFPPLNCCYGVDLLSGTSTSWASGLEKGKQTFPGKGLVGRGGFLYPCFKGFVILIWYSDFSK